MASTIITPKKNDNTLLRGAKQFHKKLGEGEIMNMQGGKQVGEWNGQELPLTKQGRRIRYSMGKRRYLVIDESGKEIPAEALDELVKKSYLTYWEGPDKGKLILTADPANRADPFFNHPQLHTVLQEGNGKLDPDVSAMDKLIVYGLRGANDFGVARGANNSGRIRYILSDKGEETNVAVENMKKKELVYKLLANLTDAKRLTVAKIMGLGVNHSSDRGTVDLALHNAIESKKSNADGISQQDLFISICNMDSEELNLRHLIADARVIRVIKPGKTGFTFNGNRIASTDKGLYEYFSKSDNREILNDLTTAMGRVVKDEDDKND